MVCKGVEVKSVIGNRLGAKLNNCQVRLHILCKFIAVHAQVGGGILGSDKPWNNDHPCLPRAAFVDQVTERVWLKNGVFMAAQQSACRFQLLR